MQQRRLQPLETRRRPAFEREAAPPPDSWVLPPWAGSSGRAWAQDIENSQGQMMDEWWSGCPVTALKAEAKA
jgi:hypothetical protein